MEQNKIDSDHIDDFLKIMGTATTQPIEGGRQGSCLNLDPDNVKNGLAQLVLTVVKLLRELLERQAVRRIEAGSLTDDQIEKIGLTLMRQAEELDRLRELFGLEDEDLNLDLGPLGKLL